MNKETRLILAIVLSMIFMLVEVVGGYLANSLAIYSDAAHLLTDIAGFGIALLAAIASKAPGTKHLTFGLARAEVFGALASILSLWVITAYLLYAAFCRADAWFKGNPEQVDGFLMFCVACFGVLVNLCLGQVFHEEHGGDFHPGHSHEHHGHGHDHGHSHGHGHDQCNSKKSEIKGYQAVAPFEIEDGDHGHSHQHSPASPSHCDDHNHDHGHSHGHDHCNNDDHTHGHEHKHEDSSHKCNEHSPLTSNGTLVLHTEKHVKDVNLEAAYLHVITDLIQSVGVALAGLVMWFKPHWEIIDPICTFIFSFVALYSTIPLLKRVFLILFEGTPLHVDWETVMDELTKIPGVEDVHDLHIWSISSKSVSLTCHVRASNPQVVLREANNICRKLGIDHTTIQVHDSSDPHFCYSQTCDWEHENTELSPLTRSNLCVTNKV